MFDTVFGLPLHPLLVHLPVVLLPLSALAVLALVFRPAWLRTYWLPTLGLVVVGALGAVGARLSGAELAQRVGTPDGHALFGTILMITSLAYLVLVGGWLLLARRDRPATGGVTGLGWVSAVVSSAVLVLTVLTGHSGATAAWSGVVAEPAAFTSTPTTGTAQPTAPSTTEAAPTESAAPSPSASRAAGYTMEQVSQNDSSESCWAVVEGDVYDLTAWIAQHPGGEARILALCGTDATAAFTAQHSGDQRPQDQLTSMRLGALVD